MPRFELILLDVRHALRSFRRTPVVALTVIVTLSVALALNASVFAVFNAYVLRPAAVADSDSLYLFTWMDRSGRGHRFSWSEYEQFRHDNNVFSEVFARRKQLVTRINNRPAFGQLVSGEYFPVLGVGAARGRILTAADVSRSEPVVVLSYAAWQRIFGGDTEVVGKTVLVRGVPCQVVGVAAQGFSGLDIVPHDFWAPLTLSPAIEDGPDLFGEQQPERLEVIGRLRQDVTPATAQVELTAWARRSTASRAQEQRAIRAMIIPVATAVPLSREVLAAYTPIALAFALVLAIAAANIASLMLARAMSRRREVVIRLSLGASRIQIVRHFLAESMLLLLVAALVAVALSHLMLDAGVRALFATMPAEYADYVRVMPLAPDGRVLLFTLLVAICAALLLGLVPALRASGGRLATAAHGVTQDRQTSRLRHGLVVAQITMAVLLLICAGVLLLGANRLAATDLGLRTDGLLEIRPRDRGRESVVTALESSPSVHGLAATSLSPLETGAAVIVLEDRGQNRVAVAQRFASPDYFALLEIPLLAGRWFSNEEARSASPVVVLSAAAATRLWPTQSPLGKSLRFDLQGRRTPATDLLSRFGAVTVVGIAADVATALERREGGEAVVYLPTTTRDPANLLLVGVYGDVEAQRQQLDASLEQAVPGGIDEIHKVSELVAGRVYIFRAANWISATLGLLALLLTVSGVYGVLSYAVVQRTHEIGVRMALGATATGVTRLVLMQSLRLSAIGTVAGTTLALGVSRLFAATIVAMNTFDALAYASGIAIVLTACTLGAYWPARRAAAIEPLAALRTD